MNYFECDVPSGDGSCSDNSCPCWDDNIPRGTGYLYIEQSLVNFRRQYPTTESAKRAMLEQHEQMRRSLGGMTFGGTYRLGPILVCRQGAKLRNIDLDVAAADAKHWWKTGQVPLRATPLTGAAHQTPIAEVPSKAVTTTSTERSPTAQKTPIATRELQTESASSQLMEEPDWVKPLAIASLVLSIIALPTSIFGCGLLFSPLAVILGLIAYFQAKKSDSPRSTRLMALAGTILGGLLILLLAIMIIAALIWQNT